MSALTDKAKHLRAMIEGLSVNLGDEEAISSAELFPNWKVDTRYVIGGRVRYEGILYKVLQTHTSQADWAPDVAVSLFARVLIPDPEIIPVWVQPTAENAYMTGDKVYFPTTQDDVYQSLIDNNVWSPTDYPQGWQKLLKSSE